jgi:lipopolysaccharide/colanic/teichoic acid biosynthesis glycosyltransferase
MLPSLHNPSSYMSSSASVALPANVPPSSAALVTVPGANTDIALRLATGKPLVSQQGNLSPVYLGVKRAMDIAGALVLIAMLSPVMLLTLIALTITTKGRPLYSQERIGLCGRPFRMWKFRTMHVNADQMQHLVQNEKDGPIFKNRRDPRVTRIGRILRSFSIDETPQLFSVLLGQMALVGPRPPIAKEVVRYTPRQLNRLAIKPGLTCLWQVSGRSEIGFEDWVEMDLWYMEHQNLWTDLVLLVRTPWSVLSRRGAY